MKCKKCGRDFKMNECGIECPFCFSVYTFTKEELDKLYFGALAAEKKKRFSEAASKFRITADEGMPLGAYHYGECLEWGRGVKASISSALEMYSKASQKGVCDASYAYYRCVSDRKIQDRDICSEALYRLRIAAVLGKPEAMTEIAMLYESGTHFPASIKTALFWYKRADENEEALAMSALAEIYFFGKGVEKNDAYAKYYLQRAMHRGRKNKKLASALSKTKAETPSFVELLDYSKLIFELALDAEERNELELAFNLFLMSAELGNVKAEYRTALYYSQGMGTERNEETAVNWYSRAAEKGYADAVIALGNAYREGKGVPQNDNKCLQYYTQAAELGDARALYILADCYFNGEVAEQDIPRAVRLYQKSALKAYPAAVIKINKIFDRFAQIFNEALEAQNAGDCERAVSLYESAADMGHRGSACNLGYCYQMGIGCKKDMRRAVYYYKAAAEDGSAAAKYNLGICYMQGGGVNVDFKRAKALLTESKDGGFVSQADAVLRQMKQRKYDKFAQRLYSASCAVYRRGDIEEAIRLRVAAAKLGHAKSEFLIGCHFEFEDGLPKDMGLAREWYAKAKSHGFIDPVNEMKQAYIREKRLIDIANKVD
ncbi:MAG: sel1 repeat family protein [Ruminococcaceae bacterium]|nr:sel1 repeat family protein [Oscillospiraceae bacterium]